MKYLEHNKWTHATIYIAIYHAMSHRITSTPQATKYPQRELTTSLRSTICFWLLAFTHFLACPPSGNLCRHFVVHHLDKLSYYGLTVPPENSNPIPSRLGLLPDRMFVSFHFYKFLLVAFYSLVGTRYLVYFCC